MSAKWLSPKELGLRLRELRERLDATQAGLAKLVDRPGSQTEISKLEGGVWKGSEPNVPLLAAIAEAAGETLSFFREAEPDEVRREKLIAARWMAQKAAELRAEAIASPPTPDGVEGRRVARGRAKRRKDGKPRSVPGGT